MRRGPGALLLAVTAIAACQPARAGITLLFFRSSPVASLDGWSWAPDVERARLVAFDGALRPVRSLSASLAQPVAVAAYCGHLLVSEYTGQGVVLDTSGRTRAEWDGPFPASLYAAGGCHLLAARSPYLVQPFAPDSSAALVRELDSTGHGTAGLGTLHPEETQFLIDVANAGALAVDSAGGFYFAPLARDEISKYSAGGLKEWTTRRGLYPKEEEPRFRPNQGRVVPLELARAGMALTLGPDGHLYALGADDSTASRLRVDVLDTATGTILRTVHLGAQETAVALDAHGQVKTFDADSLAKGAGVGNRESFTPPFALPDLKGDTVRLGQFAGKVTLVNFWASWCDPCRDEFPHMVELYGKFSRKDFDIVGISDDVDTGKMRAFVAAYHPPFPILVGGGRMRATYHYRGLPYSVLLDRRGRVVERVFGFAGAPGFRDLTAAIAKEIAAP